MDYHNHLHGRGYAPQTQPQNQQAPSYSYPQDRQGQVEYPQSQYHSQSYGGPQNFSSQNPHHSYAPQSVDRPPYRDELSYGSQQQQSNYRPNGFDAPPPPQYSHTQQTSGYGPNVPQDTYVRESHDPNVGGGGLGTGSSSIMDPNHGFRHPHQPPPQPVYGGEPQREYGDRGYMQQGPSVLPPPQSSMHQSSHYSRPLNDHQPNVNSGGYHSRGETPPQAPSQYHGYPPMISQGSAAPQEQYSASGDYRSVQEQGCYYRHDSGSSMAPPPPPPQIQQQQSDQKVMSRPITNMQDSADFHRGPQPGYIGDGRVGGTALNQPNPYQRLASPPSSLSQMPTHHHASYGHNQLASTSGGAYMEQQPQQGPMSLPLPPKSHFSEPLGSGAGGRGFNLPPLSALTAGVPHQSNGQGLQPSHSWESDHSYPNGVSSGGPPSRYHTPPPPLPSQVQYSDRGPQQHHQTYVSGPSGPWGSQEDDGQQRMVDPRSEYAGPGSHQRGSMEPLSGNPPPNHYIQQQQQQPPPPLQHQQQQLQSAPPQTSQSQPIYQPVMQGQLPPPPLQHQQHQPPAPPPTTHSYKSVMEYRGTGSSQYGGVAPAPPSYQQQQAPQQRMQHPPHISGEPDHLIPAHIQRVLANNSRQQPQGHEIHQQQQQQQHQQQYQQQTNGHMAPPPPGQDSQSQHLPPAPSQNYPQQSNEIYPSQPSQYPANSYPQQSQQPVSSTQPIATSSMSAPVLVPTAAKPGRPPSKGPGRGRRKTSVLASMIRTPLHPPPQTTQAPMQYSGSMNPPDGIQNSYVNGPLARPPALSMPPPPSTGAVGPISAPLSSSSSVGAMIPPMAANGIVSSMPPPSSVPAWGPPGGETEPPVDSNQSKKRGRKGKAALTLSTSGADASVGPNSSTSSSSPGLPMDGDELPTSSMAPMTYSNGAPVNTVPLPLKGGVLNGILSAAVVTSGSSVSQSSPYSAAESVLNAARTLGLNPAVTHSLTSTAHIKSKAKNKRGGGVAKNNRNASQQMFSSGSGVGLGAAPIGFNGVGIGAPLPNTAFGVNGFALIDAATTLTSVASNGVNNNLMNGSTPSGTNLTSKRGRGKGRGRPSISSSRPELTGNVPEWERSKEATAAAIAAKAAVLAAAAAANAAQQHQQHHQQGSSSGTPSPVTMNGVQQQIQHQHQHQQHGSPMGFGVAPPLLTPISDGSRSDGSTSGINVFNGSFGAANAAAAAGAGAGAGRFIGSPKKGGSQESFDAAVLECELCHQVRFLKRECLVRHLFVGHGVPVDNESGSVGSTPKKKRAKNGGKNGAGICKCKNGCKMMVLNRVGSGAGMMNGNDNVESSDIEAASILFGFGGSMGNFGVKNEVDMGSGNDGQFSPPESYDGGNGNVGAGLSGSSVVLKPRGVLSPIGGGVSKANWRKRTPVYESLKAAYKRAISQNSAVGSGTLHELLKIRERRLKETRAAKKKKSGVSRRDKGKQVVGSMDAAMLSLQSPSSSDRDDDDGEEEEEMDMDVEMEDGDEHNSNDAANLLQRQHSLVQSLVTASANLADDSCYDEGESENDEGARALVMLNSSGDRGFEQNQEEDGQMSLMSQLSAAAIAALSSPSMDQYESQLSVQDSTPVVRRHSLPPHSPTSPVPFAKKTEVYDHYVGNGFHGVSASTPAYIAASNGTTGVDMNGDQSALAMLANSSIGYLDANGGGGGRGGNVGSRGDSGRNGVRGGRGKKRGGRGGIQGVSVMTPAPAVAARIVS
ncbi:hypothetical protein HDU76_007486 [Blyttiomyces sp. JEL0837]|nr:hypothetical protein HDU76_007486 [Blyttiomyces sp. JEL0837]